MMTNKFDEKKQEILFLFDERPVVLGQEIYFAALDCTKEEFENLRTNAEILKSLLIERGYEVSDVRMSEGIIPKTGRKHFFAGVAPLEKIAEAA